MAAGRRRSQARFMESPLGYDVMHWNTAESIPCRFAWYFDSKNAILV